MSRFLFVVPPLVGHVNPLVGVAAELTRRGHPTAWAGTPSVLDSLIAQDRTVYPAGGPDPSLLRDERPSELRGFTALQFLWEQFFIPLADTTVDGVTAAVEDFGADVVVADQQALAGPLAALRTGRRWATSASTSAEFGNPLDRTPKVGEWRRELQAGLVRRHAPAAVAPDGSTPNLYQSPDLVLAFSSRELVGPTAAEIPAQVRFVGPSTAGRPARAGFPWEALSADRPVVLVTLGTVSSSAADRFLAECVAARDLLARDVQLVVVDPGGALGAPTAVAPGTSPDVLVVPQVPQVELLPKVAAVVCHGGHNTVCEALAEGVPLVVAPIRDDQPIIADQVTSAGAGVRLRFNRAGAKQIAAALGDVLGEPAFAAAARRVQDGLRAAGGPARAADLLEELALRPAPAHAS